MNLVDSFRPAVEELEREFGDALVAVALFGSTARHEARPRSDLDFLVVLSDTTRGLDRRSQVYRCIHRVVTADGVSRDITVLDWDEGLITNDDAEVTPLILNVAADAIILYDRRGELLSFVTRVKKIIELAGLERYPVKGGKYGWKSKDGIMREVEA